MIDNLIATDPKAQGQRIRAMRDLLRLSRRKFAERHSIPVGNLQNWEEGRYNGITLTGIDCLVEAFAKENLNVSKEWILYGSGAMPGLPAAPNNLATAPVLSEAQQIQQELALFHQHTSDAIDLIVADDAMVPAYQQGDLVAGQRIFQDFDAVVSKICIVQTHAGETLLREVKAARKPGFYHLMPLNRGSDYLSLKNVELFSAAMVIWLRRSLSKSS